MTTEQAAKLRRGQAVVLGGLEIIVENVQIILSTMTVLLTTAGGGEIKCKASELTLAPTREQDAAMRDAVLLAVPK